MSKEELATLLKKIEEKNSLGKNELRNLILNIIAGIEGE